MTDSPLDFVLSEEVAAARAAAQPLVALESTLISHGLPYPDNIEVARSAEAAVREGGAVPATMAVLESRPHAGLEAAAMQRLATADGVKKLSRRDLPAALSGASSAPVLGATTVSATMILAHHAGIDVFATGGIGGVHRGGEASMDVSADLFELAHTPVAVVCSGPKVILDLPRTREVLETMGVTLIGYRSDDMPAFWARHSGLPVDLAADSPAEIAVVIQARADLGISGAVLVCNPVDESLAIDIGEIEEWIAACIDEAPVGAAATPWLLAEIARRSDGRSLAANKRLIIDNARLAGEIAASLVASARNQAVPERPS
jgi:pseudouridine-5'-phosphate glycosidase